jgi:hypothetical protein
VQAAQGKTGGSKYASSQSELRELRKESLFDTNYFLPMPPETVFYIVLALFLAAVLSVWLVPNSKISKNEHDIKH